MKKRFRLSMDGLRHGLVLLILLTGFLPMLRASHINGGRTSYICVNACTTRVEIRKYARCSVACGVFPFLRWKAITPGCPLPQPTGAISPQLVIQQTPLCPSAVSTCQIPGALLDALDEYYWYRDYDVCVGQACEYNLVWSDCCRNPNQQGISNPGGVGMWLDGAYFNNTVTPCNNSAQLLDKRIFYLCAGEDQDLSLHASDVDGDSLAYSLIPCYSDSVTPVPYLPGFSGAQPLGPSWNVSLDAETGILRLVANPGNVIVAVVCLQVEEYRNGQLVGRIQFDFDVEVVNCPSNSPPAFGALNNVTGATSVVGDDIFMCSAGPICFDVATGDQNVGQNLRLYWQQTLPGATFVSSTNANVHDTIPGTGVVPPIGRFCWTPPGNGTFFAKFRVYDDHCPLYGFADKVVTIKVGPAAGYSTATADLAGCPTNNMTAVFSANGCGNGPFTYAWSGAGGLTGSTQSVTHTYGLPGSYPWQVIISDGALVQDTIRDTVDIVGQPAFQAMITGNVGLDSCAGIFTNTLACGPWVSYVWNQNSSSAMIPVVSPGLYAVTVQAPNGCLYQDTATVGWNPVDISGIVRTSLGTYLQNTNIYLIRHDTAQQALYAIDSVITDGFGYYQFCDVTDTLVFLKAAPDSLVYPNEMPTYANLSLFWNGAMTFYPLTQTPFTHNFGTISGGNPGGPGFIGGLISQGANKRSAIGDPVPGLRLFLRNASSGAILDYTDTDANGYFSFANIPLGNYEIVPDKPLVSTTNVPFITLNAQFPQRDSLDFQLHRAWLELVTPGVGVAPQPVGAFSATVSPNPFAKACALKLSLQDAATVKVSVMDVLGRRVEQAFAGELSAGNHALQLGEHLGAGQYFVEVRAGEQVTVLRIVKE